jgi:hypothetical protein
LGVSLAKELEQLSGVAQCGNGVPFISRPECVFEPVGDTWICKDLFESHTYFNGTSSNKFRLGFSKPSGAGDLLYRLRLERAVGFSIVLELELVLVLAL